MTALSRVGRLIAAMALAADLVGCATTVPAPVTDRTAPPAAMEQRQAPKLGKDYYAVKKGDTLYSIARAVGRDPKDIAAWNNLDSAAPLHIDQTLRIAPPEGSAPAVAVANPIAAPPLVEVRPLGAAAVSSETLKREPKGGKQPYSEQALIALQRRDEVLAKPANGAAAGGGAKQAAPEAGARFEPKPEVKSQAEPVAKAQGRSGSNDSGIDWMWPANGKVLSQFVDPTSKGIDIGGKAGEAVLAAAGGRVMYVGSGIRGYGNLVIIKHNNGFLSAYAHNRAILVKENQTISRGQKIAELGDSDADQPKLHFEIRLQGKPVDPLKYLPPR
jgi:lipoprotein NlpD